MVIDPASLRTLTKPGAIVQDDRPCRACGYSLKGLREKTPCPECGLPISVSDAVVSREGAADDEKGPWGWLLKRLTPVHAAGITGSLTDAPMPYLNRLAWGSRLMQVGILGAIVLPLLLGIAGWIFKFSWWWLPPLVLLPVSALAWALGVWVTTDFSLLPAADRQLFQRRWRGSIRAARVTQCCWVAASLVPAWIGITQLLGGALPAPSLPLQIAVVGTALFALAGFIGLSAVSSFGAHIAEWANDTDLADRLRIASAGVIFAPPVFVFCAYVLWSFGGVMLFFGIAICVLACALPGFWLFQVLASTMAFISMAKWSRENAASSIDRDRRRHERVQRKNAERAALEAAALERRAAAPDAGLPIAGMGEDPLPPDMLAPAPAQTEESRVAFRAARTLRVDHAPGEQAYDLAPDAGDTAPRAGQNPTSAKKQPAHGPSHTPPRRTP